jgi:hypothetical protein
MRHFAMDLQLSVGVLCLLHHLQFPRREGNFTSFTSYMHPDEQKYFKKIKIEKM